MRINFKSGVHSYFTRVMCLWMYMHAIVYSHLYILLLTALRHDPLEKVRKLIRRHFLVGRGDTSEVGLLLLLEIGHLGVDLGPLVLLFEPSLFCGMASAFAVGTFLTFQVWGMASSESFSADVPD